jgi:hypothetical protein
MTHPDLAGKFHQNMDTASSPLEFRPVFDFSFVEQTRVQDEAPLQRPLMIPYQSPFVYHPNRHHPNQNLKRRKKKRRKNLRERLFSLLHLVNQMEN